MGAAHHDRVKETTTTTGTGNITLAGAVTGFQSFNASYTVGPRIHYCIAGESEWEVGLGHLSGATTLVRDRILASSNSDAAVNFSVGSKDIFGTLPAAQCPTKGRSYVDHSSWAMP